MTETVPMWLRGGRFAWLSQAHLGATPSQSDGLKSSQLNPRNDTRRWGELFVTAIVEANRELVERIKWLEERPAHLDYRGTWKAGASYSKNMGVTHAGSIWVARNNYPEG